MRVKCVRAADEEGYEEDSGEANYEGGEERVVGDRYTVVYLIYWYISTKIGAANYEGAGESGWWATGTPFTCFTGTKYIEKYKY